MSDKGIELLDIFFSHNGESIILGRLGLKNRRIYFEYREHFLNQNIQISPFKLPLKTGVHTCDDTVFEVRPTNTGVFSKLSVFLCNVRV